MSTVEIVSGYRAPKYQLMLRKKGHEVARDSEHPRGEAVDFRLPGVPTRQLLGFVRAQRLGGVGFYAHDLMIIAAFGWFKMRPCAGQPSTASIGSVLHSFFWSGLLGSGAMVKSELEVAVEIWL